MNIEDAIAGTFCDDCSLCLSWSVSAGSMFAFVAEMQKTTQNRPNQRPIEMGSPGCLRLIVFLRFLGPSVGSQSDRTTNRTPVRFCDCTSSASAATLLLCANRRSPVYRSAIPRRRVVQSPSIVSAVKKRPSAARHVGPLNS